MAKKKRHKIFTSINLEGMHSTGKSFGFIGHRRIYVENGIPGENTDVWVTGKNMDHFLGKVISVNRISPDRTIPFCRHFGICGGCNWQHFKYQAQLSWKRLILLDALKKYNIPLPEVPETEPSSVTTFFRNRMEFSFSARRWYYEGEGKVENPDERIAMGFHLAGNPDKVLQVSECWLQPEPAFSIAKLIENFVRINGYSFYDPKEKTGLLRSLILRTTTNGETMAVVVFSDYEPVKMELLLNYISVEIPMVSSLYHTVLNDIRQNFTEGELIPFGYKARTITETCNNLNFRISPGSFYQPNPLQAEKIYSGILNLAKTTGKELVYDLYCGIGTIALHVASRASKVIGIEDSVSAVGDAVFNAESNGIRNVEFICGDVLATFNTLFVERNGKPDIIILDPPRSGTLIEIKKTMLQASPDKIIYLSCNPVSLAFDLKMLCQNYCITYIQPFDMFPQTHQIETLVLLERKSL